MEIIMRSLSSADNFVKEAMKKRGDNYYPKFHIAAQYGWINDPNGLIYINGKYHFFFQHYPYKPIWGPMHWGHVVSDDMVHWEHMPIALYPDQEYDRDGCYSGSAVNNNGILTLFYTGHRFFEKTGEDSRICQVQCMATSIDGIHFTKHGPVLYPPEGIVDFRDPKVWRAREKWWMVVGAKVNDLGQVRLYQSDNLKEWQFRCILHQAKDSVDGYMWECPDFFSVNNKDVLITSPQGMPAQEYDYRNLHQSGYCIGQWEKNGTFSIETSFREIDHGHDFYAPQTFEAADGRRIMVGWMEMWDAPLPNQSEGWSGALTLPREVSCNEIGKLYCKPIVELELLRTDYKNFELIALNNEVYSLDETYQELKLSIDLTASSGRCYGLNIESAGRIIVDSALKRLIFERHSSDYELQSCRSISLKGMLRIDLHIFIDASSIEIFVNEGEYSLTSKIYPISDQKKLTLFAEKGTAIFKNIKQWKLDSIFK